MWCGEIIRGILTSLFVSCGVLGGVADDWIPTNNNDLLIMMGENTCDNEGQSYARGWYIFTAGQRIQNSTFKRDILLLYSRFLCIKINELTWDLIIIILDKLFSFFFEEIEIKIVMILFDKNHINKKFYGFFGKFSLKKLNFFSQW